MLFYINFNRPHYNATLAGDDVTFNKTIYNTFQSNFDYIKLNNNKILGYSLMSLFFYNFTTMNVEQVSLPQNTFFTSNIHLFKEHFLIMGLQEPLTQKYKIAIMDYDLNIISRISLPPPTPTNIATNELKYITQFTNGLFAGILNDVANTYHSIIIANIDINQINIIKTIEYVEKMDKIVCMGTDTLLCILSYDSPIIKVWNISKAPGEEFVKDLVQTSNLKEIKAIDSHRFITSSNDTINFWDLDNVYSGELIRTLNSQVNEITIIDEIETKLASGSDDGMINIWDITTGNLIQTIVTGSPIRKLLYLKNINPEKLTDLALKNVLNSLNLDLPVFNETNIAENVNTLYNVIQKVTELKYFIIYYSPQFDDFKKKFISSTYNTNIKSFISSFKTYIVNIISLYDKQFVLFQNLSDVVNKNNVLALQDWFKNMLSELSYLENFDFSEKLSVDERAMNFNSLELKNYTGSKKDGGHNRRNLFLKKSSHRKKDGSSSSRSRRRIFRPKKSTKKNMKKNK